MRIFHIATVSDWEAARASGRYTTSTRGRTLAEEGFIHASRGDQWQGVRERYYADVTEPLVLLVIDTDLLSAPVVEDAVSLGGETFPHIYGPIEVSAVERTIPLEASLATEATEAPLSVAETVTDSPATPASPTPVAAEPQASFSRLYLQEVYRATGKASFVLVCVVVATFLGRALSEEWGPVLGALIGLIVGVALVRWWTQRASGPATMVDR